MLRNCKISDIESRILNICDKVKLAVALNEGAMIEVQITKKEAVKLLEEYGRIGKQKLRIFLDGNIKERNAFIIERTDFFDKSEKLVEVSTDENLLQRKLDILKAV